MGDVTAPPAPPHRPQTLHSHYVSQDNVLWCNTFSYQMDAKEQMEEEVDQKKAQKYCLRECNMSGYQAS